MPTLLDDRLVADALTALTDWSGDAQGISRRVSLAGPPAEQLLGDVQEAADAMDHHPEVDRSGDAITFRLRTHSAGGVTEYDIAFASRIDDLIERARGEGVVAGAVTGAGLGAGDTGTGLRQGNEPRRDTQVPTAASETAPPQGVAERQLEDAETAPPARGEPFVGAPAARHDVPFVPMPDTAAGEPEPGVEPMQEEGVGAPYTEDIDRDERGRPA